MGNRRRKIPGKKFAQCVCVSIVTILSVYSIASFVNSKTSASEKVYLDESASEITILGDRNDNFGKNFRNNIIPRKRKKRDPEIENIEIDFVKDIRVLNPDKHGRMDSYPYITGDTWRTIANFIYDEHIDDLFDFEKMKDGDVVFVQGYEEYFQIFVDQFLPEITVKFILVMHNGQCEFLKEFIDVIEENENMVHLYVHDSDIKEHPKITHIPIGLQNYYRSPRKIPLTDDVRNKYLVKRREKQFVYMNYNSRSGVAKWGERKGLDELVDNNRWNETFVLREGFSENRRRKLKLPVYLETIANSKFVFCPRGFGLATFRTWETLYLRSIPIMLSSSLDPQFDDLPVLLLDSFEEISEEFLLQKFEEISKEFEDLQYNSDTLWMDYYLKELVYYKKLILRGEI